MTYRASTSWPISLPPSHVIAEVNRSPHSCIDRGTHLNCYEIGKIEAAVDEPEFRAVWAFGFTGVGKTSLIQDALSRVFAGVDIAHIDVGQGMGFVELALELSALSRHESLPVGLDQAQLESDIRLSVETLARDGRLLLLSNVQHWLEEDGEPGGPLPFILAVARSLTSFEKRPLFLTSTRRPALDATALSRLTLFRVSGLRDEHVATLVRNWYFSIHDQELSVEDAKRIAPKLYGHPVAARLVAGLLVPISSDLRRIWQNFQRAAAAESSGIT